MTRTRPPPLLPPSPGGSAKAWSHHMWNTSCSGRSPFHRTARTPRPNRHSWCTFRNQFPCNHRKLEPCGRSFRFGRYGSAGPCQPVGGSLAGNDSSPHSSTTSFIAAGRPLGLPACACESGASFAFFMASTSRRWDLSGPYMSASRPDATADGQPSRLHWPDIDDRPEGRWQIRSQTDEFRARPPSDD